MGPNQNQNLNLSSPSSYKRQRSLALMPHWCLSIKAHLRISCYSITTPDANQCLTNRFPNMFRCRCYRVNESSTQYAARIELCPEKIKRPNLGIIPFIQCRSCPPIQKQLYQTRNQFTTHPLPNHTKLIPYPHPSFHLPLPLPLHPSHMPSLFLPLPPLLPHPHHLVQQSTPNHIPTTPQ